MWTRKEHFGTAELAAIRRGESPGAPDLLHLAECIGCKQQLADSLILKQMIRRAGAPIGKHLTGKEIERYHASAYEGAKSDPQEFLQVDQHLQSCDMCFAKFLRLHERLSPSRQLVDNVIRRASEALPKRRLGSLVIQKAFDQIHVALQTAVGMRSGERGEEGSLRDLLRLIEPERPADIDLDYSGGEIRSLLTLPSFSIDAPARSSDWDPNAIELSAAASEPPKFSRQMRRVLASRSATNTLGSLQVGDITLLLRSRPDPKQALLSAHARDNESGNPVGGVEIAELDEHGSVIASGVTDAAGDIWLELSERCERLRIQTGKGEDPWELNVTVRPEAPGAAYAREMAEKALATRLAREAAVRRHRERREAGTQKREAELERFRALSPEMQVAWVARDETRSVFYYQDLFPELTPDLLSRIEPEILQLLDAKLKEVRHGPLRAARKALETYLADRDGRKK